MDKRLEILNEMLYYVFDSLLIPLLRNNFYITESNVHRYKLFFFRHDVWRLVAEPAMATLKTDMFEEVKFGQAMQILQSRKLGFSQIRLLPKETTMRPIMNLRRRTMAIGNKETLGPSINAILGPVYSVFKLEKVGDVLGDKSWTPLLTKAIGAEPLETGVFTIFDCRRLPAPEGVSRQARTVAEKALLRQGRCEICLRHHSPRGHAPSPAGSPL